MTVSNEFCWHTPHYNLPLPTTLASSPPEVKQVPPSFLAVFPGHLCFFAPKCFTLLQQNIFLFCKNCNIFWSTCNFIAKSWKSSINMQILRHVYCMSKAKLLHCIYPSNTMSIFCILVVLLNCFCLFFVVVVVVPFLLKKEKNDKNYWGFPFINAKQHCVFLKSLL